MAPSVEINCRSNSSLKVHSKEKSNYPPSELKMSEGQDSEKINSGSMKSETDGKVRTYSVDRPFSKRKEEAAVIRKKFPTKVPIIVDRFHKESSLPRLDRSKFLVPQEITMSQFVTIIRNRMKLTSNQTFYLLVNNGSILSLSKTLAEVYRDHKEEDGFLHVTYASQEVFGC